MSQIGSPTDGPTQHHRSYGFDTSNFQTLLWRCHAGGSQKKINKISKSILEVSRVDSSLFVPTQQVMVHLPIRDYCLGKDHLWK
jgi:hypothetical protein